MQNIFFIRVLDFMNRKDILLSFHAWTAKTNT